MSTPVAGPLVVTPVFTTAGDVLVEWDDVGDSWRSLDYATSASVAAADNLRVLKAGDTMGGALTVNANVAASNYVIGSQATNVAGTVGFTNTNGPAVIFNGTASAGTGQLIIAAPSGISITMDQTGMVFFEHEIRLNAGSQITPSSDNTCYCGSPSLAWFQVNSHNYATISDPEQKTDIAPAPDALAQVMTIQPYTYRWKGEEGGNPKHWGFMAPDVAAAMGPEFAGAMLDKESGVRSLAYNDLVAVLWRAVQELAAEVKAMRP